jgi:hypothetical protein
MYKYKKSTLRKMKFGAAFLISFLIFSGLFFVSVQQMHAQCDGENTEGCGQESNTPPSSGQETGTPLGGGQQTDTPPGSGQQTGTPPGSGQQTDTPPGSGQQTDTPRGDCDAGVLCSPTKATSVCQLFGVFINILMQLAAIAGVLFIIWNGFLFVKAQGNTTELQKARQALWTTVIGLGILFGASVFAKILLTTIGKIVGNKAGVCSL